MKRPFRLPLFLMACLLAAFALAGQAAAPPSGHGEGYAGTWKPLRYEMGGFTFDIVTLFLDGGHIVLNEDGTGEAWLTAVNTEDLTWTGEGGALAVKGSMFFFNPVWDAEKQELVFDYTAPAIKVFYARDDAGADGAAPVP
ncbi:MAG TPA: hypothetical protein VLA21_05680 [Candidatus Limnocylindria bacterium]|nr:hypothetical protein [Candidatus Limnocylindria bacterium]